MASMSQEKAEDADEQDGQALYADEDGDVNNPDPNEFDERPAECTPFGPTPYFELVSDFFEKLQDMRGKRTAKGAKGSAEKKRALVQHMFNVRRRHERSPVLQTRSSSKADRRSYDSDGARTSEKTCTHWPGCCCPNEIDTELLMVQKSRS